MDIVRGGRNLQVTLIDGALKDVTISQIKASQYPDYLKIINDELSRIAFTTGLSIDEIDEIAPDEYEAMVEAEEVINAPLVQRREARAAKRQAQQMEALKHTMPDLYQEARQGMKALMQSAMASAFSSPDSSASQG